MIWNGGTLHLELLPGGNDARQTLDLMVQVCPTLSIWVPLGLKQLMDAHSIDPGAVADACSCLRHIFFTGAGIDPELWGRLQSFQTDMAAKDIPIAILTGYGATALPLDEFGYFCTGDAGFLEGMKTGEQVLRFDGRLAEETVKRHKSARRGVAGPDCKGHGTLAR